MSEKMSTKDVIMNMLGFGAMYCLISSIQHPPVNMSIRNNFIFLTEEKDGPGSETEASLADSEGESSQEETGETGQQKTQT